MCKGCLELEIELRKARDTIAALKTKLTEQREDLKKERKALSKERMKRAINEWDFKEVRYIYYSAFSI